MTMWTITCPHCGAVNSVTANRVPDNCPINCSRCHTLMGSWRKASAGLGMGETEETPPPRP